MTFNKWKQVKVGDSVRVTHHPYRCVEFSKKVLRVVTKDNGLVYITLRVRYIGDNMYTDELSLLEGAADFEFIDGALL